MHDNNTTTGIALKPCVLIADDSRIVRAILIKHVQGIFDFREAVDGEQAWEILLLDPTIKVLITDLTMPKLDGYGLVKKIRASRVSRIRNLPVIVVSGNDDPEERLRAKAAGANDLITKGIDTPQLLSRLEVLLSLNQAVTEGDYQQGLKALVQTKVPAASQEVLVHGEIMQQAAVMLENALRQSRNFVLFSMCLEFRQRAEAPPEEVIQAIGQLLRASLRQTDQVGRAGNTEFAVAIGSVPADTARTIAERLCRAIANAALLKERPMTIVACCGLMSLEEYRSVSGQQVTPTLEAFWTTAQRRARLGIAYGASGAIDARQEAELLHKTV